MLQNISYLHHFIALSLVLNGALMHAQVNYEIAFPNLSFNFPVEMQSSVDGSNRIFIIEQPGVIKVFPNDSNVTNGDVFMFLDISNRVSYSTGQEIGLLGMAFHPDFDTNGYVFLYYIDKPSNYRVNISRFTVSDTDMNLLDPASELIIAQFSKNQSDSNHNGGKIAFGPDGYLYASIGDGGGAGDPQGNGQNLETIFGSMIRIDVDLNGDNPLETNPQSPDGLYEIPSDNPRVNLNGLDELYAWGIRNTWKFSFDTQGNIWGADVGQNSIEEINLIRKGGNYGWNKYEGGFEPSYGSGTTLITTPVIKPIHQYNHSQGDVSVTGGYVYKGTLEDPRLQGAYIYGDYVSGRVWSLKYNPNTQSTDNELLFKTNGSYISSFGEDEFGELYFLGYSSNANIYKLTESNTSGEPTIVEGVGNWKGLGTGTSGTVECVVEDNEGGFHIGGTFSEAGNIQVSNLARYDVNGTWSGAIPGPNGTVFDLAMSEDGFLYAAGDFSEIGGITANNIAFYDGTEWNALGNGTNGPIAKISFNKTGSALYVGGVFSVAGDKTVNNIAKWENGAWGSLQDISTGIVGTNNEIRALSFDDNNNLYVGGNFDSAGGISANRIARWDGSNWSSLGTGTSGFVQAIAFKGDTLFAGGNFVSAGNNIVNRIAKFNLQTENWEALGQGISGNVNDITVYDSYIYVTGTFESANESSTLSERMDNIARWSVNEGWEALGSGTSVGIGLRGNTLLYEASKNELIVGGNFTQSGRISDVNNIATWFFEDSDGDGVEDSKDECPETSLGVDVTSSGCPIANFPPDQFMVATRGTSCIGTNSGSINITSKTSGEYVAEIKGINHFETLNFLSNLSIENLPSGSYSLCIRSLSGEYHETCYSLLIEDPDPLIVSTSLNFLEKSISLKLSGSSIYRIQLNDEVIESNLNEITLPIEGTINKLIVTSNIDCQGAHIETFIIDDGLSAYPNPFNNQLSLDVSNIPEESIEINIFDVNGKLVFNDKFIVSENIIPINTSSYKSGYYFVQLSIGQLKKVIKVFKS